MLPTAVEIQERRLGLVTPLRTGAGELVERVILLFRVIGPDGVEGVGESAPLAWAGTEDLPASRRALEQARVALLGGQAPDLRSAPAAAAAVDLALLDLESRRAGLALCHHLAPEAATSVAVNELLGSSSIDALLARAVKAVEAGFQTLKLKVGARGPGFERSLSGCVERVAALRDAVGPLIQIRLDANGAWTMEEAVVALDRFSRYEIELIEQPLPASPDDLEQLAQLRASSEIPIAADESATDLDRVGALIDAGAVDAVVLKPMRIGGVHPTLLCARRAQAAGMPAIVTSFLGSAVERAAGLHLAAAIDPGNPKPLAHGLATASWLTTDVAVGQIVSHGRMAPTGPGHGVTLAET